MPNSTCACRKLWNSWLEKDMGRLLLFRQFGLGCHVNELSAFIASMHGILTIESINFHRRVYSFTYPTHLSTQQIIVTVNLLSVAHDGHCPKSHLHGWRAGRGAAHFASWVGVPGECFLQEEPLSKSAQFFDPTKPFVSIQVDIKKLPLLSNVAPKFGCCHLLPLVVFSFLLFNVTFLFGEFLT